MRDWFNNLTANVALKPQIAAITALVGEIVDHGNAEEVIYVVTTGVITDADATFVISLEHGEASNLSDTADAAAFLSGTLTFTFASDTVTRKIRYKGLKRYGRLTITGTNDAGATPVAAVALLCQQRVQPTS